MKLHLLPSAICLLLFALMDAPAVAEIPAPDPHATRRQLVAALGTVPDLLTKREFAAAERIVQDAIATDPKNAGLHELLGIVLYRADKLKDATAAWETAARLDPKRPGLAEIIATTKHDAKMEKNFQKTPREHFLIKYEGDAREDLAQSVTAMLETIYREVGQRFQSWPNDEAFSVILYTDAQYQTLNGAGWSIGLYDGRIRIRAATVTAKPEELQETLAHEYAHALIFRIFGPKLPIWLNEGLAQNSRADRQPSADELKAWNALPKNSLAPPWTLNVCFSEKATREQVNTAYLETQFFVRYLLERYDMPTLTHWGKELAAGKTIEQATATVFAQSPEQLFKAWKESSKK